MQTPKGHVLYCEDHDDTRILITLLLEQAGFQVTSASRGMECLRLAESGERFNLYLLDHIFPDASGVEVCRALRKMDAETPILFYSGRAMPQEKEAAMRAGANDYLIKPFEPARIAEHIAKWVEARRAAGEAN
jgi:CheY-like chemotaxis protein